MVRTEVLTIPGRRKSLVLYGDTRVGKTLWARSLGKHLYFGGLYSGAEAMRCDEADYAIFDDMDIKFFPGFKNWLGCQFQFQVKKLYRDPVIIQWGKPCIWVNNRDPRESMDQNDVTWMEGNCIFVEVTRSIVRANTE